VDEDAGKPALIGPAIVVAGYNRANSLDRLLNALFKGNYYNYTVPLHISIDQGHAQDVVQLVESFDWPFGPKELTLHNHHLGLKDHMLWCGDLSQRYGEIILLEDDLFVSPPFYDFAVSALQFYQDDQAAAGISLYHYEIAESCGLPFQPIHDGFDVYCIEWPSSWGLAMSARHWNTFRAWQKAQSEEEILSHLPSFVKQWEAESWKRLLVAFLRANHLSFVYPRVSLSTHFGEPGTHSVERGLQHSHLLAEGMAWRFCKVEKSLASYDAWFELIDTVLGLWRTEFQNGPPLDVDLYGCKELSALKYDWVLSSRWLPPEIRSNSDLVSRSFSMDLLPPLQNVIAGLPGDALHVVKKSVVENLTDNPNPYLSRLSGWTGRSGSGESQQNLSFSIVVPESGSQIENELTVASLLKSDYPHFEVIVVAPGNPANSPDDRVRVVRWPADMGYWQALELGFKATTGDVVLWLHPGQSLATNILKQAAALLADYQEIDWLLLRQFEMELPGNRWTKDRFARSNQDAIRSSLGPGFSLIRRKLWLKLGSGFLSGEAMLVRLFGEVVPFAADLVGAQGDGMDASIWGASHPPRRELKAERSWAGLLLSRMSRTFFLANGGLRWLHMELEQYPPVIRWDEALGKWNMQRY